MKYKQNEEVCHCKKVSLFDIENALYSHDRFEDVEKEFDEIQKTTGCSTGCGRCHDKVMDIISELISG